VQTGEWKSYEDIVKQYPHAVLNPNIDFVDGWFYNGKATVAAKAQLVLELGLGGVMIWEVGQESFDNQKLGLSPHALLPVLSNSLAQQKTYTNKLEL